MNRPRYWRKEYREYMNSPAWRNKRRRVLCRARGRCEWCHEEQDYLEVHHLHYRNFKKEKLTDLLAVCPGCHEELDEQRRKQNEEQQFVKRVTAWMVKVEGRNWTTRFTWTQAVTRFRRWLAKTRRK